MVGVEQWAVIRRMHFVAGLSIEEVARRTGRDRDTVRPAMRAEPPPAIGARRGRRAGTLPGRDPPVAARGRKLPGRFGERLEALGYPDRKTIVDDDVREVRPLVRAARGRFSGRSTAAGLPVGSMADVARGPGRLGGDAAASVVIVCLGCSRAGAGAFVFSWRETDICGASAVACRSWGRLPRTLIWDSEGAPCTTGGHRRKSSPRSAGNCRSAGGS